VLLGAQQEPTFAHKTDDLFYPARSTRLTVACATVISAQDVAIIHGPRNRQNHHAGAGNTGNYPA
jgi:hypothetical protein